jgi:hypothetical protein
MFTATVALLKVADGYTGIEKHRAEKTTWVLRYQLSSPLVALL